MARLVCGVCQLRWFIRLQVYVHHTLNFSPNFAFRFFLPHAAIFVVDSGSVQTIYITPAKI
jgi:hypothetical protein